MGIDWPHLVSVALQPRGANLVHPPDLVWQELSTRLKIKTLPHLGDTDHHVGDVTAYCADASQLLAGGEPKVYAQLLLRQTSELKSNVLEAPSQNSAWALDDDLSALRLQLDCSKANQVYVLSQTTKNYAYKIRPYHCRRCPRPYSTEWSSWWLLETKGR